jgi:ATP-dependent Lhr-like helicase
VRQRAPDGTLVAVCGADPLNQAGQLLAGAKVPNLTSTRLLYRDGVPVATWISGAFNALEPMDAAAEWSAKSKLMRGVERIAAPVETEEEH